jgi:replication factor C large subunit
MELWVDKHKPGKVSGIVGQGKALKEVMDFLGSWKPGQGAFLHGPPGVGKTLTVEVMATERGLSLLRMNASDSRTANEIEDYLGGASQVRDLFGRGKLILIDEADGISSRERGAVGSISKIIKQSKFPVFVIANDAYKPKLAPLRNSVRLIKFGKVMGPSIEKRLREISREEGIEADEGTLKSLSRFAQGDLRSAISDLQMVAQGRGKLRPSDLEILGFRERRGNIFSTLPVIFHSRRVNATRKAIFEMDRDPDEVLLWIESNVPQEIVSEKLPDAYELLSRADMARSKVHQQQNWRFKAYMTDLMSGISVMKGETHKPPGFRPYQQPTRIMMLGRSRGRRAVMDGLARKIGSHTHSSRRTVMRDYLPYIRMLLPKAKGLDQEPGVEIEKEELEAIR